MKYILLTKLGINTKKESTKPINIWKLNNTSK